MTTPSTLPLEFQPWLARLDELAQQYFETPTPQFVQITGAHRWAKDWATGRTPEEVWEEQQDLRINGSKITMADIFGLTK